MNINDVVDLIANLIGIITVLVSFLGATLWGILKRKRASNRLHYLKFTIDKQTKRALRYYIPTRGQNIDPCSEDDYSTRHTFVTTKLVPYFIRTIFKQEETQYFLVLADSGMGKTTFLLKLFMNYYKKIFRKHDIVLIPLSLANSVNLIREISDKSNTILLLDGFDEDIFAMEDYHKRLKKLCDEAELFYKVIITCRTQFFPSSADEPQKVGKMRIGVGKK